jgi:hypothetical protein
MKTIIQPFLKPAAYAIVAIAAIWAAYHFWFKPEPAVITVTQPIDHTFAQTSDFEYKPASTPFESKKTPLVRQPEGIPAKDIAKAVRIIKKDSTGRRDTTGIILTKDGQLLVDNAAGRVESVYIANYVPPILDWGLHLQVGISIWKKPSPAIAIAPLEVEGCVQLPVVALDLYGLGLGANYRLSHYSFGVIQHYSYLWEKQIKFIVTYNL